MSIAPPDIDFEQLAKQLADPDPQDVGERAWVTLVWNDPVNLMSYVELVFQELFGHSKKEAHRLMLMVHEEGRAVVSTGSREQMEHDVARCHAKGLWATLQQD